MTFMDTEWFTPPVEVPVLQGDLLLCRDPKIGVVEEICLVITADCDISKGKFGRQLGCLRVISFAQYLRTIWADRKLRRIVETEADKVRAQAAKWHSQQMGVDSNLSAAAVMQWVQDVDPSDICVELGVPKQDSKKFTATLTAFRAALRALQNTPDDHFAQLVAFSSAISGRDPNIVKTDTLTKAQNEQLPDDVFLFPNLPQIDSGPSVALLREIVGVAHDRICYRTVDAYSNDMFLRVGRLQPAFKYAISQAFGSLYSKIGLPDGYERRCKDAINQIRHFALG